MNRALRRVSLICLVLFVALLININWVQGFDASSLANEPGNGRTVSSTLQFQRGSIVTADQKIVAYSKMNKNFGEYQRHYPGGPIYAPVTGYDTLFSQTGIEGAENKELAGTDPALEVHNLIDLISGKPKKGATVTLTVNSAAQQAAYAALKASGREGGVVALNPQTGAIIAMASYPSYNPELLATLDGNKLNKNDKRLLADPGHPLINNALSTTFPPGSTFKIVTSSTAFVTGKVADENTPVFAPTRLTLPGTTTQLINDNGSACNNGGNPSGNGKVPLIYAFTVSCNTVFGALGEKLSGSALKAEGTKYGFNNPNLTVAPGMQAATSNLPLYSDPAQRAGGAIGQQSDTVTPLQEAMLSATVANDGTLMKPYLVQKVTAPDLSTIATTTSATLGNPITPAQAQHLQAMMTSVVQSPVGTAHLTAGPQATGGILIAGKTGTAQNGINNSGLDDAVFTCYAPTSNPQIAVGVVVKGGGFGADAAAPVAVKIIEAYLHSQGKG
jgi:penicillin-binding protein A